MAESSNEQAQPQLCPVCQQFFGNPQFNNMCSKCYKESQIKVDAEKALPELVGNIETIAAKEEETKAPVQANPNRCYQCNRKLGLMPFICACQFSFCSRHRLPMDHSCTFDYIQKGAVKLAESNPEVKPDKINKI